MRISGQILTAVPHQNSIHVSSIRTLTVGAGISPAQPVQRRFCSCLVTGSWTVTTGEEFHLAPKLFYVVQ